MLLTASRALGGSEVKRVRRGKATLPIQDIRLESCSCTYTSYSLQKKREWEVEEKEQREMKKKVSLGKC